MPGPSKTTLGNEGDRKRLVGTSEEALETMPRKVNRNENRGQDNLEECSPERNGWDVRKVIARNLVQSQTHYMEDFGANPALRVSSELKDQGFS